MTLRLLWYRLLEDLLCLLVVPADAPDIKIQTDKVRNSSIMWKRNASHQHLDLHQKSLRRIAEPAQYFEIARSDCLLVLTPCI